MPKYSHISPMQQEYANVQSTPTIFKVMMNLFLYIFVCVELLRGASFIGFRSQ